MSANKYKLNVAITRFDQKPGPNALMSAISISDETKHNFSYKAN